jgi:hypothetical protein
VSGGTTGVKRVSCVRMISWCQEGQLVSGGTVGVKMVSWFQGVQLGSGGSAGVRMVSW